MKKGTKGIVITISIITALVIGLVVCILCLSNKDSKGKNNKPTNNAKINNISNDDKDKDSVRKLSDDEVLLLMDKVKKYFLFDLRNINKKIIISKDNLTNEMLYSAYYYASSLDDSFEKHWEDGNSWSFSTKVADEYFQNAFGFIPKEYKSIMCLEDNIELLYYSKSKSSFVYNDEHPGHGMWPVGFLDYVVTDSKKEGNVYTVYAVFLTGNMLDGFYINADEFMPDNLNDESEPEDFVKEFRKRKDDLSSSSKFALTFEKEKNNYYFKSIELIK